MDLHTGSFHSHRRRIGVPYGARAVPWGLSASSHTQPGMVVPLTPGSPVGILHSFKPGGVGGSLIRYDVTCKFGSLASSSSSRTRVSTDWAPTWQVARVFVIFVWRFAVRPSRLGWVELDFVVRLPTSWSCYDPYLSLGGSFVNASGRWVDPFHSSPSSYRSA